MFHWLKFFKYNTIPKRIKYRCQSLVMAGAKQAFALYQDKDVREMLRFSNVNKVEQDRYFNEMVATNHIMLMMILDQEIVECDDGDRKNYLKALRGQVTPHFLAYLREIGIPGKFVHIWKKLIDLRYDEYENGKLEWRDVFMEVDQDAASDNRVMIFQTTSFGLYDHLKRGDIEKGDPLYKRIQMFQLPAFKGLVKKIG